MKTFNCLEDQELREGIKEYRLGSGFLLGDDSGC